MKKMSLSLPQTLWAFGGIMAALTLFVALPPARADQQNLLPALTDDTGWALKKIGRANATLGHDDEGMVVQVAAVDGQPAHVEVDHSGVSLAEGKIYLLTFEGRSDEAFALVVGAGSDAPKPHSIGLNQTVYLTPHWTPFHLTFTAHGVAPSGNLVPQFFLGRQTGNVYLRNASLVQLAAPPPPDAGLPTVVAPHKGETTLNGSLHSLLPNNRGFVMWVTGKVLPGRPAITMEPPHLQTVLWATAKVFIAGKPVALKEIRIGDLISVVGTSVSSSASLQARQIQVSHGLEPTPPAP